MDVFLPWMLQAQEGKFINPISDVCWECPFPITLSGVNITPGNPWHRFARHGLARKIFSLIGLQRGLIL